MYEKYNSYKDSGVEWLGMVPEHWEVEPGLKFIYESKEKNKGMKRNTVLSLSYGNIRVREESELTGLVPESFEAYQLVNKGDLIFRPTDLQNDKVSLRSSISNYEGIITSAYLNLRFKETANPQFFHYLFRAIDNNKVIYGLGSGLRQNIDYRDFRRFEFPFPPLSEQTSIASFLDEKTAQIDHAIELKEKTIALLKEHKQIMIQELVTGKVVIDNGEKVIDNGELKIDNARLIKRDEAEMKDSGVEWIGRVPRSWEVKRLRNVFTFSKGLTITKENLEDEGVYCVNYGEIHSKYGFELNPDIHPLRCVNEDYLANYPSTLIYKGDFVFADTSEDLEGSGNFTYLNHDEPIFAGYHTVIARPMINFNSRFLAYEFQSLNFRSQVRARMKGVKVYSITQSILKDMTAWIPSQDEQNQIVNILDNKSSKIDRAIVLQEQEIEKLKELKETLIDSAVTGKINV